MRPVALVSLCTPALLCFSTWVASPSNVAALMGGTVDPDAAAADSVSYVVQVRAFVDAGEAGALAERLRSEGWDAGVTRAELPGGAYYRVRVGRFASPSEARLELARIERRFGLEGWIAPQPSAAATAPDPEGHPEADPEPDLALWRELREAVGLLRGLETDRILPLDSLLPGCEKLSPFQADSEALLARAEARRRDRGLDAEAGLRMGFEDRPVEEGVTGAYLGLSMQLFQSGLFGNRALAEVMETQAEAARVRAQLEEVEQQNRCRVDAVRRSLVPLTRRLLDARAGAMEVSAELYRRAYLTGSVYLDEVLGSESALLRTRTTRAELAAVEATDPYLPEMRGFPNVIDVDVAPILERVAADEQTARLLDLRQREVRLGRATDDRTRLRLYVRYGVRPEQERGDGVSAGLVFSKPLFQSGDAGLGEELEAERRRTVREVSTRTRAVTNAYERFQAELSRSLRQHYHYLENLERARRSLASWSVEPAAAEPARAVVRLLDVYEAALERADALEQLYKVAAEIFVAANLPWDPHLIRTVPVPGPEYRGRAGTRGLYIWSDHFDRYDNAYLIELFKAKGFQRVLLSSGGGTEGEKLADLRARATANDIDVELVLSTNAWLDPEHRDRVSERVRPLDIPSGGVHLDVEPHARPGFDEDPNGALEAYVDVVRRAREAAGPTTGLGVSVPIWWPVDTYRELTGMVDRFYLMAYGETDARRLAERLNPLVEALGPDRLVLVLRASDFGSEWELDVLHDQVLKETGIQDAAVHDLAGFLALMETQR